MCAARAWACRFPRSTACRRNGARTTKRFILGSANMRRNNNILLLSSVAAIGLAMPLLGHAQDQAPAPQAAQAPSPGAKARDAQAESEQIIVTGTARAEGLKKLDASYSITSISDEQIKQAAPSSTADLLKVVPGLFAESSSGESGPNVEVRGFPGNSDAPFVTYLI